MRAGQLRHRCALQRAVETPGRGGSTTSVWSEVGQLWAEITIPTGRIKVAADQLTAFISAEIRVRYRTDIVAGMRIVNEPSTYLVEAVLPDNGRTMLRLLCSNVVNP
ncbi:phage head closure protein [Pseudomonas sp. NPDC090202]|uniref:phage head closure protein n=1 Tax=Pseudomonas sp. NPDC090202 TaxID=3364476 RepID=UPI0037FC98CB